MMLPQLRVLLKACTSSALAAEYRSAVIEDNALLKPTVTSRRNTFQRLEELYALDPNVLLFRALRDLWYADEAAQPLIALLCATGRDPILLAMTRFVLSLPLGTDVTPSMLSQEAERQFPGKFIATSLQRLGRNVAATWAQAGLLQGKGHKKRARAVSRPASVAYALLLADLCGNRGQALFETLWATVLDAPPYALREQAVIASQQGWIEYRSLGDVVEVSFRYLMRDELVGSE